MAYIVYLGKGIMHIHWSLRKSLLCEKNFGTFFHFFRMTGLNIATKIFASHKYNPVHGKFCSKHAHPLRRTEISRHMSLQNTKNQSRFLLLSSTWNISLVFRQHSFYSFSRNRDNYGIFSYNLIQVYF